jgi:hypothetical protein
VNCVSQLTTARSVGDPGQACESLDQRVVGQIAQVLKAAGADHEQRNHQQHQSACAVVASEPVATERLANPAMQPEQTEVPAQQLQATVRGQVLGDELNGQIGLDDASRSLPSTSSEGPPMCEG